MLRLVVVTQKYLHDWFFSLKNKYSIYFLSKYWTGQTLIFFAEIVKLMASSGKQKLTSVCAGLFSVSISMQIS